MVQYVESWTEVLDDIAAEDSSDYEDFWRKASRSERHTRKPSDYEDFWRKATRPERHVRKSSCSSRPLVSDGKEKRRKSVSRPRSRPRPPTTIHNDPRNRVKWRRSHSRSNRSQPSRGFPYERHTYNIIWLTLWTFILPLGLIIFFHILSRSGGLSTSLSQVSNRLRLPIPEWYNRSQLSGLLPGRKWYSKSSPSGSPPKVSLNALATEVVRTERNVGMDLLYQLHHNWSYPNLIQNSSYGIGVLGEAYLAGGPQYAKDQASRVIHLYTGPATSFMDEYIALQTDLERLPSGISNEMLIFKRTVSDDKVTMFRNPLEWIQQLSKSAVDFMFGRSSHTANVKIEAALTDFIKRTLPMIDQSSHKTHAMRLKIRTLCKRLEDVHALRVGDESLSSIDEQSLQVIAKFIAESNELGFHKVGPHSATPDLDYIKITLDAIQQTEVAIIRAERTLDQAASLLVQASVNLERSARPEIQDFAYDVEVGAFLWELRRGAELIRDILPNHLQPDNGPLRLPG